ncbi:translocation/assembly module TamB domain-containing protein [Vibrio aquimaris]|uniref:Translocation and assembly module TamB n=1 Tax=Vibrio aquimaris TaxID=2587862 RepID=A0A5P9CGJ7_9VIBR|nr:translocation/assembly module TamB domain-containing protein [Vibrio aquimaris]QFT25151.1 Translocation and assembly module TamB [Vibrio aquimaris]
MTQLVIRCSKWFSVAAMTLIAAIVLGLSVILFTTSGLKFVIWAAEKSLPQLEIESYSGAVFPRFTLNKVSYQDQALNLDVGANSITLGVDVSCLVGASICIDELALNGLKFYMPEASSDPQSSAEPETDSESSVSLPIPLIVKRLSLSDLDLNILGYQVQVGAFTSGLSLAGQNLTIDKTLLSKTHLILAQEKNTPEPASAPSTSSQHDIELPSVVLPLDINLKRLDIHDFTLVQDTPVVVNNLAIEAEAVGSKINLRAMQLDMPQLAARLNGEVNLVEDYPISLDLKTTIKQPIAKGQIIDLNASGSVANLSLDAELGGLAKGKIQAFVQPLRNNIPFELSLLDVQAQWPLLGEGDYLVSVDSLKSKGSLDRYDIALDARFSGKEVPESKLTMFGQGNLKQIDLDTLSLKTLGGEVSGQLMANWQAPINWSADLLLKDIQPGMQWQDAEGQISGRLATSGALTNQGGWKIAVPKLDIDGVVRDYPLKLLGQLSASDETGTGDIKVTTSGLALSHGPNFVKASGVIEQASDMKVEVSFADMSLTVPNLRGNLKGNLILKDSIQQPRVGVMLKARDVGWGTDIDAKTIDLEGELSPLTQIAANIKLSVFNAHYQNYVIDHVLLNTKGNEKSHTLSLDVVSDIVSTQLNLHGELERLPELVWKGNLDGMFIKSKQGVWTLESETPVGYSAQSQQVFVAAHCWQQEGASICLDKDINVGQKGEAKVSISNIDFSQLQPIFPKKTELKGDLNLSAMASWAPDTPPVLTVDLGMGQGMVNDHGAHPIRLGWESVSLKAALKDNVLSTNWLIDLADNGDFSGHAKVFNVVDTNKSLDGELQLTELKLDFLEPFLGDYSQFKSTLNSQLSFAGPIMKPKLKGQFVLDDLFLKGEVTPVEIESGNIDVKFSGYGASLTAAVDTPDGQLQAKGEADWRDLNKWQTNLRVFADELMLDLPPMVKVKVIPDMTISASPKQARIDGTIALPWGKIVVEELPPSAIGVSKDQVLLNEHLEPESIEPTIPFSIETNVNISIGDELKLSAFGLEGNLSGNLNVSQRDKGPFVTGEVNIINGSYRSFGQDLIIQQGKILMNGPVDQPFVQITAIRNPDNTQDDYTAGIKVIGPVDEPSVTIFSEPNLPQANALSYLLRGRDIDGESGGNSVTSTLIGLSLAKSGRVVGEIGEAFGVQDLQLDTAGSGDESQVTVSGYVLPGLQVKYGVGIFDSVGEFTVRYRLMQDLYVEAMSGLDSAVELLYQFEFN